MSAICCQVTAEWVSNVTELLLASTEGGIEAVQEVLPHKTAQQILEALYDHLKKDPTVVDVSFCTAVSTKVGTAACKRTLKRCVRRLRQQHQTHQSLWLVTLMGSFMMYVPCKCYMCIDTLPSACQKIPS